MKRIQPLSLSRAACALVVAVAAAMVGLVACLALAATPSIAWAAQGERVFGVVTAEMALYDAPEQDATQESSLSVGTALRAVDVGDGWYGATFDLDGDGASTPLYFSGLSGIALYDPQFEGVSLGVVVDGEMSVYVSASDETAVTSAFDAGTAIQFVSFNEDYYAARLPDGSACFIPASHVSLYAPSETGTLTRYAGADGVSVYLAPDYGTQVASFEAGTELHFVDYNDAWVTASMTVDGQTRAVFAPKAGLLAEKPSAQSATGEGYDITLTQLVEVESDSTWLLQDSDGSWVTPSTAQLRAYLNPANFPEGTAGYYQFMRLDQASGFTVDELNGFLEGDNVLAGQGQAFYDACNTYGVNEAYLIAHAELETGNGTSTLATGVWYDPDGDAAYTKAQVSASDFDKDAHPHLTLVYNMFGIGAYDGDPLYGGAKAAYKNGWTSVAAAIAGGAQWISSTYFQPGSATLSGQNTLYKMLFHPEQAAANWAAGSTERPWHQYATGLAWAASTAEILSSYYASPSSYHLTFEVPVYAGN